MIGFKQIEFFYHAASYLSFTRCSTALVGRIERFGSDLERRAREPKDKLADGRSLIVARFSKQQFHAQLHRARAAGAGDLAEVGASEVRVRVAPSRRVDHAERFAAELELKSFLELEAAEDRGIQAPGARTVHEVAAEIAEFRLSTVFRARLRKAL